MGRTPARTTGRVDEFEEALFQDRTADGNPTVDGSVRFVSDDLVVKTAGGVVSLTAGTGLSAGAHKVLRQLIHFLSMGPATNGFLEILPEADPFPTSYIWYDTSSKIKKIVELLVTRNAQQRPTTIVMKAYDTDGSTVLETTTDTVVYSGAFPFTFSRVLS